MKESTKIAAKIVYPMYLEVDPKIAEDLQRRIEEALDYQAETHAREIANMCKDAWDEATKAILDGRRTVGYCSFCNKSLVCHTLSEAQEKQREHTLRCPEMHKALLLQKNAATD